MKSGIYRIRLGGVRLYVGSSGHLANRERRHLSDLRAHRHCNRKIQAIWNKHQVFEFTVLMLCPVEELQFWEQALLNIHFGTKGCANLSPTAGSTRGYHHTDESKANMSKAAKESPAARAHMDYLHKSRIGIPLEEEHRKKVVAPLIQSNINRTGELRSAEYCKNNSEAQKISLVAKAHVKRLNESKKGVPLSAENRNKKSESAKKSPAVRANMERLRKVPRSPETRAKMSASRLAYLAREREAA